MESYSRMIRIKSRWAKNWLVYPFRHGSGGSENPNPALEAYQKARHTGPEQAVCHAPMRSIYFGFEGKATPCCFNREFLYGTYPEQDLAAIVGSGARRQLQKSLEIPDFSKGCQHCASLINSGDHEGVEAWLYDSLKNPSGNFPVEMIFELDNTCNLECIMCEGRFSSSILKNREGKSYRPGPYGEAFVEQLTPYLKHLTMAKFLGGEPFLIRQYYLLWEQILGVNPGCILNLQTNGTVYNDRIENLLKKGRFQIGISIDSLEKSRFEEIRKGAVFEEVMRNLDHFIHYTRKNGSFVNLSVCPMQQNRLEIPDLVNFCNEKKIFIYFNTVYTKNFDLRELSAEELRQTLSHYRNAEISGKGYIARRNRGLFDALIHLIEDWCRTREQQEQHLLRRHSYSMEAFAALFEKKLPVSLPEIAEKLRQNLARIPSPVWLSDAQLELLDQIPDEEFTRTFIEEEDRTIRERLENFLKHGEFFLAET